MLVGLHVATNFQMYRQNSDFFFFFFFFFGGGGGDTLMAGNAKEADMIWPGICARGARQI